ncbi:hypothetical protein EN866_19620 [Mesorhizobium sp. M2D.F.Ca.ET.223.01.1.1]|uniref:hypothetical protein n=1 Tax=unclassified Mesorhizobium TaxID=325217 RepID=UPI000FCA2569|nr:MULTISPECIES: hypothetical protein [unclassified Mesorhizobium]TGP89371.1 hypothetical protein EN864_19630 [bacterium M00.F.Ca.ET.221.01.1.1]TGP94744.1 hypothetical protein EN865_15500 [bacterium M00.F.Ca.ET.222.01.1.1]RVD58842.1 hypothetical protein EN783_14495 [Mesorhizobium sp. M2D.F.Ca.ET.140.01.1.1]TGP27870.1 hypothetical protein EN875_032975 [Mesorhizobium sp. M2D.F.Ca.ET.232.01.1.1]TGP75912.1 hypothetical protein EN867_15500 [Mesorhizobium sp. M2D.F.Ca.ET.224.01.1.1]
MSNIISLTARRAADAAVRKLLHKRVDFTKGGGRPKIDPHAAKKFYSYTPIFETKHGDIAAKLREVTFSKVNGETIAYYDLVRFDPASGLKTTTTYLYGIRQGKVAQLRRYEPRYSR